MNTRMIAIIFVAALGLAALPAALGCDTPVYRYALENWIPDAYPLVLLHRGALPAPLKKLTDELNTRNENGLVNAGFLALDVEATSQSQFTGLLERYGKGVLPRLALLPPKGLEEQQAEALWDGAADEGTIAAVLGSPARREIAKRLIGQKHAAVWVLLESGDQAADEQAARLLAKTLAAAPGKLREAGVLAPAGEGEATTQTMPGGLAGPVTQTGQTSQTQTVVFSLVRVSRGDEKERFFVRMLDRVMAAPAGEEAGREGAETRRRGEAEKSEKGKAPVAIPVFARGRALVAFAGEALNEDHILGACAVLAGPCACELKAQNPGVDMLFDADWMRALEGSAAEAPEIPSLGSVQALGGAGTTTASAAGAGAGGGTVESARNAKQKDAGGGQGILLVSGGGALLLLLVGVGVAGVVIRSKQGN